MGKIEVRYQLPTVIAAYNEKVDNGLTLGELPQNLGSIYLLVEDSNSDDRKVEIVKEFGAAILLKDVIGKEIEISQAIQSLNYDSSNFVYVNTDFSFPYNEISKIIRMLKGDMNVGMVFGNYFSVMLNSSSMKNPFFLGNKLLAFDRRVLKVG